MPRQLKGGGKYAVTGLACAALVLTLCATRTPVFAQEPQADDAPPPSFQDVLRNPGDPELNFRYARAQVKQGHLKSAATALDRILVQRPDLNDVRLLYAVVLYRLGDLNGAQGELERVDPEALPDNLRAERARYLDLISRRLRKTTGSATVAGGVAYQSNASAAPDSGQAVVFDIPLDVQGEEDDVVWRLNGSAEIDHELDTSTPITLFGQVQGSVSEHVEVDSQDTRYGVLRGGARIRTLWADVIPSLSAGALSLSNEQFYRFAGPGLRVERPLGGQATAYVDGTWFAESFDPIQESQTADDRSGHRVDLRSGLSGAVTPDLSVRAEIGLTRKTAREDFEAYDGLRFGASASYQVLENQFLQASATFGLRAYDDNDPFISARERYDRYARLRISYGLPVPYLSTAVPDLEGLMLVPSVEYYRQTSNIRNFEYENVTASVMLMKSFDF